MTTNTQPKLLTYNELPDHMKQGMYNVLYTVSFMLLAEVTNPLFDLEARTVQVAITRSDGVERNITATWDAGPNNFTYYELTSRIFSAVEQAAK